MSSSTSESEYSSSGSGRSGSDSDPADYKSTKGRWSWFTRHGYQYTKVVETGKIDINADIERCNHGIYGVDSWAATPLYIAAYHNRIEQAKYFISVGADPNRENSGRCLPPLHIAIQRGHLEMAKFLLKNRADANLKTGFLDITPLQIAVKKNRMDIMKMLLDFGAELTQDLLLLAIEYGRVEICEFLLKQPEIDQTEALHKAVLQSNDNGSSWRYDADCRYSMVQTILKNHKDPASLVNQKSKANNRTPLQELVFTKAKVDSDDSCFTTESADITRRLVELGADLDEKDELTGKTCREKLLKFTTYRNDSASTLKKLLQIPDSDLGGSIGSKRPRF